MDTFTFDINTYAKEISDEILSYLPKSSMYQCLLVSKSWHSCTIPLLYDTVIIHKLEEVKLLFRTITSSHLLAEQNEYIKHIRFIDMPYPLRLPPTANDQRRTLGLYDNYLYYMHECCPFLDTWIIHQQGHMCELYGDTGSRLRKAHFKENLRLLNIKPLRVESAYINTLCSHEGALDDIHMLSRNEESYRRYGGVIGYLQLFPSLSTLWIGFKDDIKRANELYFQILEQCPMLIKLEYKPGWNTDFLFNKKIYSPYPCLMFLSVKVHSFTYNHIRYIKNTFVKLKNISLTLTATPYNNNIIINTFIEFGGINALEIVIHDYAKEDVRQVNIDFWKHMNTPSVSINRMKMAKITHKPDSAQMEQPHILLGAYGHTIVSEIFMSDASISYYDEECAELVEELSLKDFPKPINTKELNTLFPRLRHLKLYNSSLELDFNDVPMINHDMDKLYLRSTPIHHQMLSGLQFLYPNLSILHINISDLYMCKEGFDMQPETYVIQLPWNRLSEVRLDRVQLPSYVKNVVGVKKHKGEGLICCHYESIKGENTQINRRTSANDYILQLEKPVVVIEYSTTLKKSRCHWYFTH